MTSPRSLLLVPAACAALLLASACEGSDSTDASATPTASATPAPTTPSTAPTGTDGADRGIPREAEVQVVEVTDTCVYVAVGDSDRWALRGEVPQVATGDRLTVSGAPDDTTYPECPDGSPFLVSTVEPLG